MHCIFFSSYYFHIDNFSQYYVSTNAIVIFCWWFNFVFLPSLSLIYIFFVHVHVNVTIVNVIFLYLYYFNYVILSNVHIIIVVNIMLASLFYFHC